MSAPDQHPLDSQLDLHLVHWFPLIRISQNPVQPDFRLFVHLAARRCRHTGSSCSYATATLVELVGIIIILIIILIEINDIC